MTSEIINPDSFYAYITVIKQTPKCALSPRLFIELLEMLTPSQSPHRMTAKVWQQTYRILCGNWNHTDRSLHEDCYDV